MAEPSVTPTILAVQLNRFTPSRLNRFICDNPTRCLLLEVLVLVVGVLLLTRLVTVYTLLPVSAYFEPLLFTSLAAHINPLIWIFLSLLVLLLWQWGDITVRWLSLPYGSAVRVFVLLLAGSLVWVALSVGTNHYFAQSHLVDRGVLVVCFALLAWRPLWLLPFLLILAPLLWQFGAPELGGSIFAHKLQVLYPLMAVTAAFFYYAALGRWPIRALVLVLVAMIGAAYWEAAVAKYSLGWLMNNELHLILPAANNHGWLAGVAPAAIARFAASLEVFDKPLQMLVLMFEAAVLLTLFHRRLAVTVLLGLSVFHLGVFAYYGFFFWTWILVNVALVWLILKTPKNFFGLKTLLIGAPLILLGNYWAHAPSLGWLDTRLSYVYELDVVAADGRRFALSPRYFDAYADVFAMASFSYLSPRAVLTAPYGVTTDKELAERLREPLSVAQLSELEQTSAPVSRPLMLDAFTHFVRTYVATKQGARSNTTGFNWLRAPRQFWGERESPHLPAGVVVERVLVREVVQLAGESGLEVLRDDVVLTIPMQVTAEL